MRKILIFAIAAFLVFYSCKRETATNSPDNLQGNLQILSTPTVSASGIMTEPLGVDLTGFQLLDICSSEICPTISGTVVFYIASDRTVKPLCVYNFVYRYKNTNIYRGEYTADLEPFTLFGETGNTYKLTINPRGNSINKVILALVRITFKENGVYAVQIDSGAIKCH